LRRHRKPAEVKKYSPPKKLKKRKKRKYDLDALLKQAHENGVMISSGGLYQRLHKGMSKQEAVTKPLQKKDKYIDIAESNGISRQTYYSRRNRGWGEELASTWPVGKSRKKVAVKPTASDDLSESEIDRILNVEVQSPHSGWF